MAKNNDLKFTKMSGNGNDFILMDNFDGQIKLSAKQIEALCSPKFSIGADGLILLEKSSKGHDFFMKFYNNDGKEAEMCGNGGGCIAGFAFETGRAKEKKTFLAKVGLHNGEIKKNGVDGLSKETFDLIQAQETLLQNLGKLSDFVKVDGAGASSMVGGASKKEGYATLADAYRS